MTTAVIEAMATGLAIIATTHSGFPDQVIPGQNGYLSREADPEDFAAQMLRYIEHPEQWSAMSKASRALALKMYDRKPLIARQHALYQSLVPEVKTVAFIVGIFPVVSETWFINQVADLLDRGVDVRIYAFKKGDTTNVSERYFSYDMASRTVSLEMPSGYLSRIVGAIPRFFHVLFTRPALLPKIFDVSRYGANAYSLKMLYRTEPLMGLSAELVHCHFGTVANRYLQLREILGLTQPFLTSFYGVDISQTVKEKGNAYYDGLREHCARYIVMSNNMKERVAAIGFDPNMLEVLPISVDVEGFPYNERTHKDGEPVRIISVGRFVEKKGFDDLLRAMKVVKARSPRPVRLSIVGGPKEEEEKLRALADELGVSDVVEWKGYMKSQDVIQLYLSQHLYVQASKTASNGDME